MSKKNDTYWSLSRVAKETGKSKSVISSALKDGTLSYVSKNGNSYQIDPAEVQRVYGEDMQNVQNARENGDKERSGTKGGTNQNTAEKLAGQGGRTDSNGSENALRTDERTFLNKDLERQVEVLNERLSMKDEHLAMKEDRINELATERDDWKKQAQTLAIRDHREDKPIQTPAEQGTKKDLPIKAMAIAAAIVLFIGAGVFSVTNGYISFTPQGKIVSQIEPAGGDISE